MANAEDYLDELLDSVKNVRDDVKNAEILAEANQKQRDEQRNRIKPDDDFMEANGLNNYSPKPSSHINLRKAFSEEDFLRSFEEELGLDEMDTDAFIRDFEEEIERNERAMMGDEEDESVSQNPPTEQDMSFLDNIESIVSQAKEQIEQGEIPDDLPDIAYDLPDDISDDSEEAAEEGELLPLMGYEPDDMDAMFEEPTDEPAPVPDEEMPPLLDENDENADLMDLLSGDSELGDIGDLLQADDKNIELEEAQEEFDAQADAEGSAEELLAGLDGSGIEEAEEEEQEKGIKGILAKIKSIFSKKEKKQEGVLDISQSNGEENLTEENLEILKSLDAAEAEGQEKEDTKKKKRKERKEEEKKEKEERKEKKEKKPKKEKVKKEKKPDNSPKIPGKIIFVFVILGASVVLLITIGQKALGYRMAMSKARAAYENTEYFDAYEALIGMEMDEDDIDFFRKTRLLGDLQKRYQEYNTFVGREMYDLALDSLLTGVGRYDENYEEAKSLGIENEYKTWGEALTQILSDQFGVSSEEAIAMYKLNREDYSIRLDEIIDELELN